MANWWDAAPKADSFDVALSQEGLTGPAADIARSIYAQESSSGKNTRTSNAGAVGGMQIIPSTFKSVADKDWDINDPVQNNRAGIRYVKQLYQQAGGDPSLTASGYYGGPGGLEKARRGVAVSDPRNPNAPDTLQYGQQVAARIGKQPGIVQRAVEAVIPSANAEEAPSGGDWWASAPIAEQPSAEGIPRVEVRGTSADEPSLNDRFLQGAGNVGAGLIRGAGSIGATLLAPIDAAYRATGLPENDFIGRTDRRQAMDQAFQGMGVDTDSMGYAGGKLGAEIAGTLGAGGALAAPFRTAAPRLAQALTSGGLSVGQGAAGSLNAYGVGQNLLLRVLGGGAGGAAAAGLINPEYARMGAATGAVLPPALRVAGATGGAAMGAIRSVRDIATAAGQNRIADQILRASATNPEAAAANLARARELVPGSSPTIGQAAVDPGLAQLERTLGMNPESAATLQQRYAQQRAARGAAIDEVAATAPGSGSYYDDIAEGRRIFANEDYAAARRAGVDEEMAASMQPEIASLLERPSIQSAVADARRLAAETGEEIGDLGSITGLDWLKKSLDNQISKAAGPNSAIGKADLAALQRTSADLNSVIEQIAPAYREANRNYAQMSRQINSMDVARDLERTYTPASEVFGGTSAKEQGAAYMKALRNAQDNVKKSTGRNMDLSDAMSTPDIYRLENVARDLSRKSYLESAGNPAGSATAQNMMSQNMIRNIMEGAGLPAEALSNNTLFNTVLRPVEFAAKLATPRVLNRLAELAISPQEAAIALQRLPPAQANQLALQIGLGPVRAQGSGSP